MTKQEAALPMSCNIVPYVTTRSMPYRQPVNHGSTAGTHEDSEYGGGVSRCYGVANLLKVIMRATERSLTGSWQLTWVRGLVETNKLTCVRELVNTDRPRPTETNGRFVTQRHGSDGCGHRLVRSTHSFPVLQHMRQIMPVCQCV
jgi:hypothetical protein